MIDDQKITQSLNRPITQSPDGLEGYYLHDPRLILVPIEHLTPAGMSARCARLLRERCDWSEEQVALFDRGFSLYWQRTASLAARTRAWAPPRLRHVGVVREPGGVRPYAQLLNTSAWTVYASDLDPQISDPELFAYVLVHGDRMALLGEVTYAAVHNAAYWFDRTDHERAAFAAAAARSPRPDADGYRAIADATPWLAQLHHETLQPPPTASGYRSIPDTGLLVPEAWADRPPALIDRWASVARHGVATFRHAHRAVDRTAVATVCDWLVADRPPLLVTAGDRVLWDPEAPSRIGPLREALKRASGAGVRDIAADLRCVAVRTRTFLDAVVDVSRLPPPESTTEQRGYVYLHRDRRLTVYDLHEPGIERLEGPALPYARAMLGARTLHEWAHLAAAAGWVPPMVSAAHCDEVKAVLARALDAAVDQAAASIRQQTADDLDQLVRAPGAIATTAGAALATILLRRLPDYQANLLSMRFMDLAERETYVRQNLRALRSEYPPARRWRMLVRYLYEFQYLAFSEVEDRREFFLRSTWFDADFFASGALTEETFDVLTQAVEGVCTSFAVDESRFRVPSSVRVARTEEG